MFKLTPEGRQRVDGNDVVRQTVPEFDSSNRESPTANSRQLDLWHYMYKTIGASRAKRSSTRQISDANEWTEVGWRASVQDFVRNNSLYFHSILHFTRGSNVNVVFLKGL